VKAKERAHTIAVRGAVKLGRKSFRKSGVWVVVEGRRNLRKSRGAEKRGLREMGVRAKKKKKAPRKGREGKGR